MQNKFRPIAFHLPQFHPIPENDEWWGKGFTEWTNVTKAKPLFKGHYQPHLPSDLGFYDLRLEESRIAQAELARQYGIYGFCYYHYWFNGKRLLEKPVEEILKSGKPDFPFMLCWANENWSRRWDGSEHLLLMKQEYSREDARAHCKHLMPYFKDPRYIKISGKPVFAIYKPRLLDALDEYVMAFREEAKTENLDLYICWVETNEKLKSAADNQLFDAAIEFQPHSEPMYNFIEQRLKDKVHKNVGRRIFLKIQKLLKQNGKVEDFIHSVKYHLNYEEYVDFVKKNYNAPQHKRFPGITPMWDNTARRGKKAFYFTNATPLKYGEWLDFITKNYAPYTSEENFIFINAWNEWAEGNHLEPCQKWGRQYLEVTRSVMEDVNK
jgi:lipopolysaccharide biosynthesis protein